MKRLYRHKRADNPGATLLAAEFKAIVVADLRLHE